MANNLNVNNINLDLNFDNNLCDNVNYCDLECKYITEGDICEFFNTRKDCLNMVHVNCRSLKHNFSSFSSFIDNFGNSLMISAVTETWLNDIIADLYQVEGYVFVYKNRKTKLGGVGMYINSNYEFRVIDDLSKTTPYIECIFIELSVARIGKFIIGCVYRPPNSDIVSFNNEIRNILNNISIMKIPNVAILGDFNIDVLKYDSNSSAKSFIELMLSHSLVPVIKKPTRLQNSSCTLIDNIFVNCIDKDLSAAVIFNDISDHFPIGLCIQRPCKTYIDPKTKSCRIINENCIQNFMCDVYECDWSQLYTFIDSKLDINYCYDYFNSKVAYMFNKNFPMVTKINYFKTIRNPWMTYLLVKSCHKKSKLYKQYKKNPNSNKKIKFVKYRNTLKKILLTAEKNYYADKIRVAMGNQILTWKAINSIIKCSNNNSPIKTFTTDNKQTTDKKLIANKFNEYFANIGKNLAKDIPSISNNFASYLNKGYMNSFFLLPTDDIEIRNIISSMKNTKSCGVDQIPTSVIKSVSELISTPLSKLINLSFNSGSFPDLLKIAKVCPIFKNGDKKLLSNYRPISILPNFAKIFEKAMYNRLCEFLEKFNMLTECQFGFRKSYSTSIPLLNMYDCISDVMDKGYIPIGIFIDLSKAFDTLDHNILLYKLNHYGVRGQALDWFRSYLTNRVQYTLFEGVLSDSVELSCGVPQGSILGPLLFLLYVNDIVNSSNIMKFWLFADDTNLFYYSKHINELIHTVNTELNRLFLWFCANKLSLNIKKTTFMVFGNKSVNMPINLDVKINNIVISRTTSTKFLGIIFDDKLKFSDHVNYVSLQLAKSIGIINKVKYILPKSILLSLYYTLVYPHLLYGNIVWGNTCSAILHKLVVLQNKIVRIINKSGYLAPTANLYKELKIIKIYDINKCQTLCFMFKLLNNLLPSCCANFLPDKISCVYSIRNNNYFNVPACRTLVRERSFAITGPKLWNNLTQSLKSQVHLNSFKKLLYASL